MDLIRRREQGNEDLELLPENTTGRVAEIAVQFEQRLGHRFLVPGQDLLVSRLSS